MQLAEGPASAMYSIPSPDLLKEKYCCLTGSTLLFILPERERIYAASATQSQTHLLCFREIVYIDAATPTRANLHLHNHHGVDPRRILRPAPLNLKQSLPNLGNGMAPRASLQFTSTEIFGA